jgi:hypothetical protein
MLARACGDYEVAGTNEISNGGHLGEIAGLFLEEAMTDKSYPEADFVGILSLAMIILLILVPLVVFFAATRG